MEKPIVSIVIPVYNGANYMKEAIDSALNQTYPNCEVIVINDGSNDNGATEKIALSYGDRIRYIKKENGGVATAVNRGIKEMKGEYFSWLSHDDYYYPQKIEKQIEAIEKSGDKTAIAHSNFDFLNMTTGEKTSVDWLKQYDMQQLTNSNFAPVFLCIHGCSILIHKSHFERVGLYDPELIATQDSVFLFHVMRGQKSVFVPESLFVGRIHGEQGSQTLACHRPEYNKMFENFCEWLTDDEKINMCGSVFNFYYRLYVLLKQSPKADTILGYLKDKLLAFVEDEIMSDGTGDMNLLFPEWKDKGVDRICLFGAGDYGKRMLNELQLRGFLVHSYIDNDEKKWNTRICGIPCYGMDYLVKHQEHTAVIVSALAEDEIKLQLKKNNIKYIKKYSEIYKKLFYCEPLKSVLKENLKHEHEVEA
ncbi:MULTISPECIES: glycosyltransferase [Roseburia]|uniref:glycosyltransferase n=1 Tax=Roseburia TaxID=841 RepID=UPI001D1157DB|nr:glycosyltransferase [Roseburia sp. CLA-AA-H209]